MTALSVLVLGLLLLVPLAQQKIDPSNGPPPGFVEIDSAKIPDHVAWRTFFLMVKDLSPGGVAEWPPLTADDKTLVLQAAAAQEVRDSDCYQKMVTVSDQAKKEGAALLQAINASRPLRIPCRQKDLDAADALMEKLTPEGRSALQGSVDKFKSGLKASVPRIDLPDYWKPR